MGRVEERDARNTVADAERGFEGFGQSLRGVGAHLDAVDDRFDRVLAPRVEFRRIVELDHAAVDASAHESLAAQFLEDFRVLALAVGDDGRKEHEARAFRVGEHLIDHLAHGLRREIHPVIRTARDTGPRI